MENLLKAQSKQGSLDLRQRETLIFSHPLYYLHEKTTFGVLSQLALDEGNWVFDAIHIKDHLYNVTHETGLSFQAELKSEKNRKGGTYTINGCVKNTHDSKRSFFDGVNIQATGLNGCKLRPAQLGAVYALF